MEEREMVAELIRAATDSTPSPRTSERLTALARRVIRWVMASADWLASVVKAMDASALDALLELDPATNPAMAGLLALVAMVPAPWVRFIAAMIPMAFRLLRTWREPVLMT